ncbi:protein export cytoplasm protein SecA2 ATPase RNA helicase [Lactobacillus rhamnosus]|uniref:Protein export cytoplasm protein SecA2 ATPase RNA helicase n=1 Tax=Lacticaseibacillus rhamnosus TaxID=47715 RepID=A0A7Y7QHZ0_LACRH|nr:protein export cytoplasm protein SecA2 ATPase RNA helicase [Lacticaseibacillus rhamnosus]NVO89328.1 protein export cytoplasm protein SecA2 ATPase RNA helicase [Lacticaseibacillus rhamnosus]
MRRLRILLILILGGLLALANVGVAASAPVFAANRPDPPAATPVSPDGQYWKFLVFYDVSQNGLVSQPSDQSLVATSGTQMTVDVPMVTTNMNGFIWGVKRLSKVSYQQYNPSSGWPNKFTDMSLSVGTDQPTTSATGKLPVTTTPGTYYFQLKLTYTNNAPQVVYSRVFAITIVPQPVKATAVNATADPTTVLWGQSIGLNAHLTPTNSTASVAWGTNAASGVGAFTNVNGRITSFKTEAPSGNTNAALQTNNGTPVTFTATATNDDKTTVSGKVQVTIGGLNPLTVQRGTSFSVKPAALDGVTYPSKPTFKWHLYKDQKGSQDYSPVAGEQITNNTDTLNWQNIQAAAGTLYYQLEVEFDSGQKSYWYSNIAPLTVTASAPQLHAVPNLQFALSSGANPSIADFYAAQGVTMVYQPSTIANQTNWDGNNHGALAVAGGGSTWSLNVQFSPFKNQTTQHYLSTETGGSAAVTLHFADGTAAQAKDDRQPVTVYNKVTKDVTTTTATTTSLQVPQTSTIQPGTYQSTATWTLVKAP